MDANNKELLTVNYALNSMEVIDSKIAEPEELINPSSTIGFFINIEHKVNIDEEILSSYSTFVLNNSETSEVYASITVKYDFNVENLKKFFNVEANELLLPNEFIVVVNSISISSSRGVIHMLFNGTNLRNFVLPIIDPTALIYNNQ